jgi:hypothetical protein
MSSGAYGRKRILLPLTGVLKRVKSGEMTQVQAAEMLGLSYRQV